MIGTRNNITVAEAKAVIAANSPDVLEAAERAEILARWPAYQGFSNPLPPPDNAYDPSAEMQQSYFDRYVREHVGSERLERHGIDDRAYFTSQATDALHVWRKAQAHKAWCAMLAARTAGPACAVCGASSSRETVAVGQASPFVCRRCRPSVIAAVAAKVAAEKVANGRRRDDAAAELVAKLIGT
jgi:hypothetical protein